MTSMASKYIVEFGLGDWNSPQGGPKDYTCPVAITDTAYYYVDTKILAVISRSAG